MTERRIINALSKNDAVISDDNQNVLIDGEYYHFKMEMLDKAIVKNAMDNLKRLSIEQPDVAGELFNAMGLK